MNLDDLKERYEELGKEIASLEAIDFIKPDCSAVKFVKKWFRVSLWIVNEKENLELYYNTYADDYSVTGVCVDDDELYGDDENSFKDEIYYYRGKIEVDEDELLIWDIILFWEKGESIDIDDIEEYHVYLGNWEVACWEGWRNVIVCDMGDILETYEFLYKVIIG